MNRYDTNIWKALTNIQNSEKHCNHDIMTITGFMNDNELIAHVNSYTNENWLTLNTKSN